MAAARTALFFDVFARNRASGTFGQIIKSTDTLRGKIAAVGKLAAGAAAAGLAAFAVHGVRSFLEFDSAMTRSLAIMGDVSGPMRERMEDAARSIGKTTVFGANEAAEAYFFLASAGLDAEQAVSAMPQVAEFAQAGMFDLARATDLATDAQSALGLSVEDPQKNLANLTRVTDTLVGANTLANASVEQFSTSLTSKAGPAMRAAGIEIEEGVAVLAAFADQGLKGEMAGSRFTAMLEQMQRKAIDNADEFDRLNVAVFDSEGNMRNMADIVGDLETALGGMSVEQQKAELMQLGFNRSALDGIMALLGMSDQISEYESELQGMAGITGEVADKQRESFEFQLGVIKSFVTDAAMQLGEVLVKSIFKVGETIGEMGRMFKELPGFVQVGITALGGLAAATPLAIGSFRKIRDAIRGIKTALAGMTVAMRTATLAMGGIGIALAAGATILAFFARQNLEAEQRVEALAESLDRQNGAITANTRQLAFNNLEQSGAIDSAKELGIRVGTLVDAYLGDAEAIAKVNAVLDENEGKTETHISGSNTVRDALTDEAEAARDVGGAIEEGNEDMEAARERRHDMAAAGAIATESDEELAAAEGEVAAAAAEATGEIEEQTSAIDDLISSLNEMVETVFAARDAERGYEKALDDASEAVEENGATLDINTEKGRKNQESLDRLAEAALRDRDATLEDAEAKGEQAEGVENAREKMERAREEFVNTAIEMGKSREAAEELATELGLIPEDIDIDIEADTSSADSAVSGLISRINNSVATIGVGISGQASVGRLAEVRQHGGPVFPGRDFLVGEEGPELVRFSGRGHVFPAHQTREMVRGQDGDAARDAGIVVEQLTVKALTDRFSLRQVEQELALHGAS